MSELVAEVIWLSGMLFKTKMLWKIKSNGVIKKIFKSNLEMDKPESRHGERFVKVKAVLKTWTEVEDVIEYDTYHEQFLIPAGYQIDTDVVRWSYVEE